MSEALYQLAEVLGLPCAQRLSSGEIHLSSALKKIIECESASSLETVAERLWQKSRQSLPPDELYRALQHQGIAHFDLTLNQAQSETKWDLSVVMSDDQPGLVLVPKVVEHKNLTDWQEAAAWFHEMANATGASVGWIQLMRRKPELGAKALYHIERSNKSAEHSARQMTQRLRRRNTEHTYKRLTPPDPLPALDLHAALQEIIESFSPELERAQASLHSQLEGDLYVGAHPEQITSVLGNLIKNAIESFSKPNGEINIATSKRGDAVRITVSDNGAGIPSRLQEKIFEPYFTTKAQGTGLGLPWVKRLVERLDGTIELTSAEGRGTSISISLPSSMRGLIQRPTSEPPSFDYSSGIREVHSLEQLRILVVDDEPSVRELITTALELRGAKVQSFSSASAALNSAQIYDLAVIDFTLKDGKGDILLAKLRKAGLVDICVMCSGTNPPKRFVSNGEPNHWLRKPFDLDDLVVCIKRVIKYTTIKPAAGKTA